MEEKKKILVEILEQLEGYRDMAPGFLVILKKTNNEKRDRYIQETENFYIPFFKQHNPKIAEELTEIIKYIKLNEQPTKDELQQIKQIHDSYELMNQIIDQS